MEKQTIRLELIKKRESISKEELGLKSRQILEKLFSIPEINEAKNIGVYLSFRNEVETKEIIEKLWEMEKNVFVPASDHHNKTFSFAKLTSFSNLVKDSFGVLEPSEKEFVGANEIDLFLVPGVAFDSKGYRLGWGKGYYDKFFNFNKATGKKIGLAFEFQLVEKLPRKDHDVKMDFVVSEKGVCGF